MISKFLKQAYDFKVILKSLSLLFILKEDIPMC